MRCLRPIHLRLEDGSERIVPCSKCPACLTRARQEWAFRLREEWKDSEQSVFVTLTYDNEHLPIKEVVDEESGAIWYVQTVMKEDVQAFMKRFRNHFPGTCIRYYAISEYGDERKTFRPHYHIIFFFDKFHDVEDILEAVRKSWKSPEVTCGQLDEGAVIYCTYYCLSHNNIPDGANSNFRLVSRGGRKGHGLGFSYVEKMGKWHQDRVDFAMPVEGQDVLNMPRYYRMKIFTEDQQKERSEDLAASFMKEWLDHFNDPNFDLETFWKLQSQRLSDEERKLRKTLDKKMKKI